MPSARVHALGAWSAVTVNARNSFHFHAAEQ
jgi:hypothetical protein